MEKFTMPDQLLKVLLVCRCSSRCGHQEFPAGEHPLDRQEELLRSWVSQNVNEPVVINVLRHTMREGASMLRRLNVVRDGCNLIVVPSLDRIARGFDLFLFLESAKREQFRIVSVSDRFDSNMPSHPLEWMRVEGRYGLHHVNTRRRIRSYFSRRRQQLRGDDGACE
jgi:hypothetical protein